MSALTDRIAAEHAWTLVDRVDDEGLRDVWGACSCGHDLGEDDSAQHSAHVAEVTEAAVRAQIAADIEAQLPQRLINEIGDACGWLSDAQSGVRMVATEGTLRFHGEGSLDLTHAAEHAATIAKGTP